MDFKCGWRGHLCRFCDQVLHQDPADQIKISIWSAINFACMKHLRVALENGAKANNKNSSDGQTPLCRAAKVGDVEVIQTLIQHGADVNKAATSGTTPLLLAAHEGNAPAVELLISQGANVNAKTREGWTALHSAAYSCGAEKFSMGSCYKCGHLETVKALIRAGADVNAKSTGKRAGRTPLHQAYMYNSKDIIKLLIENGADVDAKDQDGLTPCWLAQ